MLTPVSLLPLTTALGWTLVHSLWQISLIYGLFWLFQRIFYRHNGLIYSASILAMFICAGWAAFTFQREYASAAPDETTLSLRPDMAPVFLPDAVRAGQAVAPAVPTTLPATLMTYIPELGVLWGVCVALLYLRLLGGFWLAQRLRRRGAVVAADPWQETCGRLATQLGITRAVRLLESSRVAEPLTLGFWRPVILFPAGLLLQLTPAQVEALLLHELAHIRRYDYVLNAAHLLLEATFFYHPLFRLLARAARTRREYCCDDVVLQHCPNRLLYARTLTDLQLSFVHRKNQFVMNATGKNNFTTRILRIAGVQPVAERRAPWLLLLLLLVCTATGSIWSVLHAANVPLPVAESVLNQPSLPKFAKKSVLDNVLITNTIDLDNPLPGENAALAPSTIETPPPTVDSVPTNPVVAVAPLKMNVLYIGVDNPVNIAVGGYDCAALTVRLKGQGSITSIGDCQYNITVSSPGQLIVQIFAQRGGKEQLLGENVFRIKRIPDPTPTFSNAYGGSISKSQLQELTTVKALLPNFDFDAACTIGQFKVTLIPPGSVPSPEYLVDGVIPAELLAQIHALEPGGALFIDDIKVKCSGDTNARNLGSLAFKIRE